jgi:hypothetical protein
MERELLQAIGKLIVRAEQEEMRKGMIVSLEDFNYGWLFDILRQDFDVHGFDNCCDLFMNTILELGWGEEYEDFIVVTSRWGK